MKYAPSLLGAMRSVRVAMVAALAALTMASPLHAQVDPSALDASAPAALTVGLDAGVPDLVPVDAGAPSVELAPPGMPPQEVTPEPPAAEVSVGEAIDVGQAIDVEVRGERSSRVKLAKSADAVTVVDLTKSRQRAADLGEVLSRVAGVQLRRWGGLGSDFRLSLNGLTDRAIRVFIDGVPIDRVYAVGIANVPLNLIDNIEIYRGVVPLRLGADALGGALNLVRPKRYGTLAQASYQVGSFGQHRVAGTARYRHEPSGFIAGVEAFFDRADNDYPIDVSIADRTGSYVPARVRRFHDDYRAYGVAVETGVVEQPWAQKLILRGFTSSYDKELQHNIVMSAPYGDVEYGERVAGAMLTYENTFAERYDVEAIGSYSYRRSTFVDTGSWVYNWRGERVNERRVPGETGGERARDQVTWQHGAFGRARLDARIRPGHMLTLSLSPAFTTRTGDERYTPDPSAIDPLSAERKLLTNVAGAAYALGLGRLRRAAKDPSRLRMEHHRLENVLFVKQYLYRADAEEPLPSGGFRKRARDYNELGAGDSLRITLIDDWLIAKTSYEYAIRLPDVYEAFGDGLLILANLDIAPERSHNANQQLQLDLRRTRLGDFWVDLNLFLRKSENMIVLLGSDRNYRHENVYGARSLGVETSFKWTAPHKYVTIDGQFTYTDQRNTAAKGTFGAFKGDRIPNRPWLTASWGGFLHFERVLTKIDIVEPFYQGRFVGDFFRGWESIGQRESKDRLQSQISHNVGLTYALSFDRGGRLYATFDVQNVSDARLFDAFGVQRPGRAYYLKLTGDI